MISWLLHCNGCSNHCSTCLDKSEIKKGRYYAGPFWWLIKSYQNWLPLFLFWLKQSLQYTGLSPRGRKGTMASDPHWAHVIGCISLGPSPQPPLSWFRRDERQGWQRFGSLTKPREAKNSCSPAVNINSPPQSAHTRVLSDSATGWPPWDGDWIEYLRKVIRIRIYITNNCWNTVIKPAT